MTKVGMLFLGLLSPASALVNTPFPASRIKNMESSISQLNATTAILAIRMAAMQQQVDTLTAVPPPPPPVPPPPVLRSCKDIKAADPSAVSGEHTITSPFDSLPLKVTCDMDSASPVAGGSKGYTQVSFVTGKNNDWADSGGGSSSSQTGDSDAFYNLVNSGDNRGQVQDAAITAWRLSNNQINALVTRASDGPAQTWAASGNSLTAGVTPGWYFAKIVKASDTSAKFNWYFKGTCEYNHVRQAVGDCNQPYHAASGDPGVPDVASYTACGVDGHADHVALAGYGGSCHISFHLPHGNNEIHVIPSTSYSNTGYLKISSATADTYSLYVY